MADIQLTDLTNATSTTNGTGVFDKLIQVVELHIEDQFQKGRLAGPEYASVYLGSVQAVLQQSIAFMLGEQKADKEAELIAAKTNSEIESIAASQARTIRDDSMNIKKELLVAAQTLGFASDTKQKVLKHMFENYAVNLSIAGLSDFPEAGQDKAIDHLVADILSEVGVTGIVNTDVPVDLNNTTVPPVTP